MIHSSDDLKQMQSLPLDYILVDELHKCGAHE